MKYTKVISDQGNQGICRKFLGNLLSIMESREYSINVGKKSGNFVIYPLRLKLSWFLVLD